MDALEELSGVKNGGKTAPDPWEGLDTVFADSSEAGQHALAVKYAPGASEPDLTDHRRSDWNKMGGWKGGMGALSETLAAMSRGFAKPTYTKGGWGNALSEAATAAGPAKTKAMDDEKERELDDWLTDKIADPGTSDIDRRFYETYEKGGRELSGLELALERNEIMRERNEAYSSGRGAPTRSELRTDRQRRNRWSAFAERGIDSMPMDTLSIQGSMLNDAMKQFIDEPDSEYMLRQEWVYGRGNYVPGQKFGGEEDTESFYDWKIRLGHFDAMHDGPQTGDMVGGDLETSSESDEYDPYSAHGIQRQPSEESFMERIFGPNKPNSFMQNLIGTTSFGGLYPGSGADKPSKPNTVRREEELRGRSPLDMLSR